MGRRRGMARLSCAALVTNGSSSTEEGDSHRDVWVVGADGTGPAGSPRSMASSPLVPGRAVALVQRAGHGKRPVMRSAASRDSMTFR